jgi:8-oxo-dGTP pyrophosphatase MutT (NUDIX family)
MFVDFFTSLESKFKKTLPGVKAQELLSPFLRNPSFELSLENENTKKSAVLLLIHPIKDELHIAFIKRQIYNGVHSGQISLPGGKYEIEDIDLKSTALREANEEIGVNKIDIKIIGELTPLYIPISNIKVFPFVGFTLNKQSFEINKNEVLELINVSLSSLLEKNNYKRTIIKENGIDIDIIYFDAKGNYIWGATAMILSEFVEILKEVTH